MGELDILSFGETMALFCADQPGDLADVTQFSKRIAGADSNVAIGLTRLGFKVGWLSRVGNDSLGRFVVASLEREGVDCRHVAIDQAFPTGFQFKSLSLDGSDPSVEYFRKGSAASRLAACDIHSELLQARHLHATGIPPAISVSTRGLSFALMRAMRDAGRSVSFDPNLRPSLWPSQAQMISDINALAALAHWVFPGLAEGQLLTGLSTPEDIAGFYLDQGSDVVVVKLGAEGAYYRSKDTDGYLPGLKVARVVDTVGAGDGFAVGIISALLEGLDLPSATARGNLIGSLAVQSLGDMEGLPTREELQKQ